MKIEREERMNIVKIISEHKKTKRNLKQQGMFHSKIGWVEAIVEENGKLVTRHLPNPNPTLRRKKPNN